MQDRAEAILEQRINLLISNVTTRCKTCRNSWKIQVNVTIFSHSPKFIHYMLFFYNLNTNLANSKEFNCAREKRNYKRKIRYLSTDNALLTKWRYSALKVVRWSEGRLV